MKNDLTYWFTLAMIRGLSTRRKNEIYSKCYTHNPQISIIDLFEQETIWQELGLSEAEKQLLREAKLEMSSNAFTVENLLSQGYDITPLDSPVYPKTLKKNLKMVSPTVIYSKGDIQLFNKPAVAVVGSRKAGNLSLKFTDIIAAKAADKDEVVVSGFAKGVDREALDASLANNGKSIIVLPQGITTFHSGFRQYYRPIQEGRVLVMSVFEPQAGWNAGLAMARNPIIYGLADKIYVAESGDSGGTWSGVIDGLKRQREIYVRLPEMAEKNANNQLIQKGALPVDINGNRVEIVKEENIFDLVSEPEPTRYGDVLEDKIRKILSKGRRTSKEIITLLNSEWKDARMKTYLRSLHFVTEIKERNRVYFYIKGMDGQGTIDFDL